MRMILLGIGLAVLATGIKKPTGYEPAIAVCETMIFDSNIRDCLGYSKDHIFDVTPTNVCGALNFDANKLRCLKVVSDKKFPSLPCVGLCSKQETDISIVSCLQQCESTAFNHTEFELSIDEIKAKLVRSYQSVETNPGIAQKEIRSAIDDLQRLELAE